VQNYRQALKLDPANLETLLSLGIALLANGQANEAVDVLKSYIGRESHDFQGYYWLGRAYKDLARYQEAANALEQASRLKPDDSEVRYNLGVVMIHLGRLAEAASQLRQAKTLNPEGADIHFQLASVLRRLNDRKGANEELKAFQALKTRDQQKLRAVQYHDKGDELLVGKKFAQAAEQFRQALELDPESPRLHYNLSLALQELGDGEGQKKELERAIQLDPNLALAYYRLGQLYVVQGNPMQAEQALKTAVAIDPQFAEAQESLASVQESRKRNP
jgi:predicted Zn-dependent protease